MSRVLTLAAALLLTGCPREQSVDDTAPTGDDSCSNDDECLGTEICEADECIVGDRDNGIEEATTIYQVPDLDGDPSASGVIAPAGDVDFYVYPSIGGEWIEIRTRVLVEDAEGLDTVITVRNASGGMHASIDDYATGSILNWDSTLQVYLPTAGSWYITVEDESTWYDDPDSFPKGGTDFEYELFVRGYTAVASEPDGLADPSRDVEVESGFIYSVGVNLRDPGDSDWIGVTLPYADAPLEIWGLPDLPGSAAEPRVHVYDPDAALVATKDDVGPDGIVNYPLGEAATYAVEATDAGGQGSEDHWYVLYFRTRDAGTTGNLEVAGNDTIETAEPMPLTELTTSNNSVYYRAWPKGTLDPDADEDWFAFEAQANTYISVRCNSEVYGSHGAFGIDIHDPAGALAVSGTDDPEALYDIENHEVGSAAGTWKARIHAVGDPAEYGPDAWYTCFIFITPFEAS